MTRNKNHRIERRDIYNLINNKTILNYLSRSNNLLEVKVLPTQP